MEIRFLIFPILFFSCCGENPNAYETKVHPKLPCKTRLKADKTYSVSIGKGLTGEMAKEFQKIGVISAIYFTTHVETSFLTSVEPMPHVVELDINDITAEALPLLSVFPNVEVAQIFGTGNTTGEGIPNWQQCSQLDMDYHPINSKGLKEILNLKNLKILIIKNADSLSEDDIEAAIKNRKWTSLEIGARVLVSPPNG